MLKICAEEKCEDKVAALGLCAKHYYRKRYAELEKIKIAPKHKQCRWPGCTAHKITKNLCRRHYWHSHKINKGIGRIVREKGKARNSKLSKKENLMIELCLFKDALIMTPGYKINMKIKQKIQNLEARLKEWND